MSNYKDLSSEELKRTLAEKQDILRRTMKPDEYKKFMQELDDCQIKIDYSKFGKPVQYPETKKEKRQRKKERLRRRSRKRHRRRDGTRAQEAEQRKQSKYSLKRRSAYQQTSGKPFLSAWSSITAMKRGEWKYSKLK